MNCSPLRQKPVIRCICNLYLFIYIFYLSHLCDIGLKNKLMKNYFSLLYLHYNRVRQLEINYRPVALESLNRRFYIRSQNVSTMQFDKLYRIKLLWMKRFIFHSPNAFLLFENPKFQC